jgi:hypothetical protein
MCFIFTIPRFHFAFHEDLDLDTMIIRFVERLASTIKAPLNTSFRLRASIKEMERKRHDLECSLQTLYPQLEDQIQKVKALKKHIEQSISKQYNGRPVNIMGDINTY